MLDEILGKHAVLSENPTIEEIAQHTIGFFEADWKVSRKYIVDEVKPYKSKPINNSKIKSQFATIYLYLEFITNHYAEYKFDGIPELAQKELYTWDNKGGFCIYSSILSFCLLYEDGIFNNDDLKLVQGFYKHPTQGILQLLNCTGQQVGIHAFITADGAVIDFGICQEKCVFDFDGYILGDIPEGMELYGWEEDFQIVKAYAREIARESGMTYRNWIERHKYDSLLVAKEALKNYKRKLVEQQHRR